MKLLGSGEPFRDELCSMLDGLEFFRGIEWRDLEIITHYVQAYAAEKDEVLFKEGEPGTFMAFLATGHVEIHKDSEKEMGTHVDSIIAVERKGRAIGEMALIDGERRSATCIVAEPSTLILLTKESFDRLTQQRPAVAFQLLFRIARLLSRRLRQTSGRLVEFLSPQE